MKYAIILTMLLTACGTGPQGLPGTPGEKGEAGANGEKGEPGENAHVLESLEGYYVLSDGGYVDIYQDAQGMYVVRSLRLVAPNADGSTGLVPIANVGATAAINGNLYATSTPAYVALTNNIKQDLGNALLAGSYNTQLYISKSDGTLSITVVISSTYAVLFNHTVKEQ